MKNLIIAFFMFASTQSFAAITKEIWTCELQGATVLTATFTKDSTDVKLVDREVKLTFKQPNQKTALNGSVKTEITGLEEGWDTIEYKITLIRSKPEDFSSEGPESEKLDGIANVIYDGLYDCIGPRVDVEVLHCSIEITR